MSTPTVSNFVFWVTIKVFKHSHETFTYLQWVDLPWTVRTKWNWYFKYRAALIQVQYPRYEVQMTWGTASPTDPDQLVRIHTSRLRTKKAKITEIENKMTLAKKEWDLIFPIEEDEDFIKCELVTLIEKGP